MICEFLTLWQRFLSLIVDTPKKQSQRIFSPLQTLFRCGDIHLKLGPDRNRSCDKFSIRQRNLNIIIGHIYKKILEVYITISNFDLISVSKSYVDSSILSDYKQLNSKFTSYLEMVILEKYEKVVCVPSS